MATKGNIDPAFQAAPNLGATSYNPLEFARRHNLEKFQIQRKRQDELEKSTALGLQNLMVELKGWEDQDGFRELMADQDKVRNAYLQLAQKGMNLTSPRTTEEIMAYKAINDAHQVIKQKADTWASQKGIYDIMTKAIEEDSKLPEDQRKINVEATTANFRKALKSKSILERGDSLKGLIVPNVQFGDIVKKINDNKDFFEKPTQEQNVVEMPDGSKQVKMIETLTPEQEKSNVTKAGVMYEQLDQSYKNTVRKIREKDPNPELNIMSDKDYFATIAVPTYREKFLRKPVGSGGDGFSINFGGNKIKYQPTERQNFKDYTTYHPVTEWPTQNIPTDDVTVWKPNGEKVRVTGKTLSLQLTGYDENTDQFTFISKGNYYGDGTDGAGDQISMERKDVPRKFDDFEILVDGKRVKVKDVKREKPTTQVPTYPVWKKANPNGTINDYRKLL